MTYLQDLVYHLNTHAIKIESVSESVLRQEDSQINLGNGIAINVPHGGRNAHVSITETKQGEFESLFCLETREESEFIELLVDIKKAQGERA